MPFFARDRASTTDDAAPPEAPLSADVSTPDRRTKDHDGLHHDTQSEAAASQSQIPEAIRMGRPEAELTDQNVQMNGSAAATQPANDLEEAMRGGAKDEVQTLLESRPQNGQASIAEDMHSPYSSLREESSAPGSNEQHDTRHGDVKTDETSDSHAPVALPDSQADEASQAAGLISAEWKPQNSSQADTDWQDSNPATAMEVLATARSPDVPKGVLEAEQESGHQEPDSLMPGAVTSAVKQARIQDAELSGQEPAQAAMEALSNEAERLEGTAIQEQTEIEPLLFPAEERTEEDRRSQADPIADSGSQQDNAQAVLADLRQLQPSEASSSQNNNSQSQPSANAIGEMLRSMQKEEWDSE